MSSAYKHHHHAGQESGSGRSDGARRSVRRRERPGAGSAPEEDDEDCGARSRSRRHHAGSGNAAARGRLASAVCVTAASTALGSVLLLAASARGEPASAPSLLKVLAACGAGSAFGAGAYALSQQRLQWSRRVRNRLLMGLAVSGVALLIAVASHQKKRVGWTADVGVRPAVAAPVQKEKAPLGPEDVALFKPGWHGEFQQYGVYVIFTSFLENAAEARGFNRRLTRPVSYAMYSVINVALPSAVAVRTYQVSLVMDSGEEVRSLDVLPLLNQRRGLNEDLLRRLEKTQTLGTGSILPDVPVCMAPDFPWERVKCVRVKVGDLNVVVPGRMYSAEEKQALSEKPAAKPPTSSTNLSAEAWYKNL